jgi:hypothetical protein
MPSPLVKYSDNRISNNQVIFCSPTAYSAEAVAKAGRLPLQRFVRSTKEVDENV